MNYWLVIRTDTDPRIRNSEAKVYTYVVETMQCEAWLPVEPRFTRVPGAKNKRQWWGCILPGRFFAAIPRERLAELWAVREYKGYDKDALFQPLTTPYEAIDAFRRAIEKENRELMRMNRNHDEKPAVGKSKRKYSKRLKRGKAAQALVDRFEHLPKLAVDEAA